MSARKRPSSRTLPGSRRRRGSRRPTGALAIPPTAERALSDPIVAAVARRMRTVDRCHTAILYGSRARGDHGPASDYDFVGIRSSGPERISAARVRGRYVDVHIVPQRKARRADASFLPVRHGVVLFERGDAGRRFLSRLRRIAAKGPKRPDPVDVRRRQLWAVKMLGRIRAGGLVAAYRRLSLTATLLEDWFFYRRRWYEGPKPALATLASEDPQTHGLFAKALRSRASHRDLAALVRRVIRPTRP